MILADHYRSPLEAEAALEELAPAGDHEPYTLFAASYARMAMGQADAVPTGIAQLQKHPQRPPYLGQ